MAHIAESEAVPEGSVKKQSGPVYDLPKHICLVIPRAIVCGIRIFLFGSFKKHPISPFFDRTGPQMRTVPLRESYIRFLKAIDNRH